MAFATKYRIRKVNPETGTIWRANIKKDDATFQKEFDIGGEPFVLEHRCNTQEPDWQYAVGTLSIQFIDSVPGELMELFLGTDKTYKVELTYEPPAGSETLFWTGYIDPDSYSTDLYGTGFAGFQAVDNLRALSEIAFDDDGTLYTGQETAIGMLANILAKTGLDIGLQTHSTKYSYLATNPLTTSNDPLRHFTWRQETYQDADGNAWTCIDVLRDILEGWELQLFQSGGRWCIYERDKDVLAVSPFTFTVWNYTSAGVPETQTTQNGKVGISLNDTITQKFQKGAKVSGERAVGQSSVVYEHGPLTDIILNTDFEADSLGAAWTFSSGIEYDSESRNGDHSLDTTTDYQAEPRTAGLLRNIEQTSAASIGGATNYKFRLRFHVKLPDFNDLPAGREAYLYWLFELVGDSYFRASDTTWQPVASLTDVQKANEVPIYSFLTDTNWLELIYVTPVLDGLSGMPRLQLWNLVEVDPGSGSLTQNRLLWDDIAVELLDPNGQQIRLARRTTASILGTQSDMARPQSNIYHGTGPLDIFNGAIRALDSTEADAGLAEDFAKLVPGSATGHTFERIFVDSKMRQFRDLSRVIKGTTINYGAAESLELKPHNTILVERPDTTDEDEYFWFESLTYRPANPENLITTSWCQVNQGSDPDEHAVESVQDREDAAGRSSTQSTTSVVTINTTIAGGDGISVVEDETELAALSVGAEESAAILQQIGTNSGVGEGIFIGDPDDVATPTDNATIIADPGGARWKRMFLEGPWRTEWFGAKWDGVTDDSAAIQLCINAAPLGATIEFPAGTTVIGTTITAGNVMKFKGASEKYYKDDGRTGYPVTHSGTVIKSASGLSAAIFRIEEANTADGELANVFFEDIHFIGNKDDSASDTHAVEFIECRQAGMRRCQVVGFTQSGVDTTNPDDVLDTTNCYDLIFEDCTFAENGTHGLLLQATNSSVRNCLFENNDSVGFFESLFSLGGNIVSQNRAISNAGSGFVFSANGGGTRIVNNYSNLNGSAGIQIEGVLEVVSSFLVQGNVCIGNGTDTGLSNGLRSGFYIRQVTDFIFSGNLAEENGGFGVHLSDNLQGLFTNVAGASNQEGLVNTSTQTLGALGTYNAVDEGLLQFGGDASTRLNELLASLPAGSTVVFPPGTYTFESQVLIQNPVTLKGWNSGKEDETSGTIFKIGTSLDAPMIDTSFITVGLQIENINFHGVGSSSPSSSARGLRIFGEGTVIRNCGFYNFLGAGVAAVADKITFENCRFNGNGVNGITVTGDDLHVQDSVFRNNSGAGISLAAVERASIVGSTFDANANGLIVNGATATLFDGNVISNSTGVAGVQILAGDRNSIINNTLDSNPVGIQIQAGTNTSVKDNDISLSTTFAIETQAGLESATILDNTGAGNGTSFYSLESTSAGDIIIDLQVTQSLDFGSIAAGAVGIATATVVGARVGDAVSLGPPAALEAGLIPGNGIVTSDDTIEIRMLNGTGVAIDPVAATWSIHTERRTPALSVPDPDPDPTGDVNDITIDIDNTNLLQYG